MSVLETLVIIIGIVMGILGNVLILIVMFSNTKLRQLSTSSLIISMAIVDCISAAFTNPLTFSLVSNLIEKLRCLCNTTSNSFLKFPIIYSDQ